MNLGTESEQVEFKRSTGEHREAVTSCREFGASWRKLARVGANQLCKTGKREM